MHEQEQLAYELLSLLQIPYERFDHKPITSVINTGIDWVGQQVKNLCLKEKKGRAYYLVILRDEKVADLKKLAIQLGHKRLSFMSPDEIEHYMKVKQGTVTPFGLIFDTENKIQVVIDSDVDTTQTVGFHPFVNTTTLNIAYSDFIRCLEHLQHLPIICDC